MEKEGIWKKARELNIQEFYAIPKMELTIKYKEKTNDFEGTFWLVGKYSDRIFYIPNISEGEVIRLFPQMSIANIRNTGTLKTKLPLRISFGKTTKNSLGYFARYEFIIDHESRNIIHGIVPNSLMEFICENPNTMHDYIIWLQGTTPLEVLNALQAQKINNNKE